MAWTSNSSILLTSDWQYTEPIPTGSFFRLKHTEAPNGGLFAIAQCEVDTDGKLALIDSQVLAVERPISDVLKLPTPGCFTERRIAIKKLPRQRTLQEELRRLILPGFLQPTEEEIRIVSRSNWTIDVEISDFVETTTPPPTTSEGTGTTTPPPTANTKTLTYASNGDTNGICYWLGTNYGAEAWTNPHTAGRLIVSASSSYGSGFDNLAGLVNRQPSGDFATANVANSYVILDLGVANRLACNYYSLKGRSGYDDNHLRNWKIQASNDNISWSDIDTQVNNTTLVVDNWLSQPVSSEPSRYFKILMDGLNSSGGNIFSFGEFEFYGTLTKV